LLTSGSSISQMAEQSSSVADKWQHLLQRTNYVPSGRTSWSRSYDCRESTAAGKSMQAFAGPTRSMQWGELTRPLQGETAWARASIVRSTARKGFFYLPVQVHCSGPAVAYSVLRLMAGDGSMLMSAFAHGAAVPNTMLMAIPRLTESLSETLAAKP
jgi:hypothetical protein